MDDLFSQILDHKCSVELFIYTVLMWPFLNKWIPYLGTGHTAVPSGQMATEMVSEIPMEWGHFLVVAVLVY